MKKPIRTLSVVPAIAFGAYFPTANATVALYDWAFNIDGTLYEQSAGDTIPASGSLDAQGLGSLSLNLSGSGSHSVIAFFDFEIDEPLNTYFNEYGSVTGTAAAGQSWEIDEPGYVFGDIYDNVINGSLDNSNNVPSGLEDDVSFALGWDFTLAADQSATVDFELSDFLSDPSVSFYLEHSDAQTNPNIYAWSSMTISTITSDPSAVPEPEPMFMMSAGFLGLLFMKRRRSRR